MITITESKRALDAIITDYKTKMASHSFPKHMTVENFLDGVFTPREQWVLESTGRTKYALSDTERDIIFMLYSGNSDYANFIRQTENASIDTKIAKPGNNNRFDYNLLPYQKVMLTSFLDLVGMQYPTDVPVAKDMMTASGTQFINQIISKYSLESCDLLKCSLAMSDGSSINSSTIYNSNVEFNGTVTLIGTRFYECVVTFNGIIILDENDAKSAFTTIFNNCTLNGTMVVHDISGNVITNNIKS